MDLKTSSKDDALTLNTDDSIKYHVVIVGAGISGLICARELLRMHPNVRISIVEASDRLGGRIRGYRCHGVEIDIGAEFIHGSGTILTDLIEDLFGKSTFDEKSDLYEPVFTVSHADGGPDAEPTVNGKYGMYYIDGELRLFDDPVALELRVALDNLFYSTKPDAVSDDNFVNFIGLLHDEHQSIGESLDNATLSRSARQLALSSYGNTAANTDLYSLSAPIMKQFEEHWFNTETSGDYRFSTKSGITMTSVVDKLVLKFEEYGPRCKFLCNWKLRSLRQRNDQTSPRSAKNEKAIELVSYDDEILLADAAIVTVSPPMLQEIDMELSAQKKKALSLVGFPRVIKVILIFSCSEPPWPEQLNNVICADGLPIPEIWFTEKIVTDSIMENDRGRSECEFIHRSNKILYLAVGYLTSQFADDFSIKVYSDTCSSENEGIRYLKKDMSSWTSSVSPQAAAARIFIHQLAQVLSISKETIKSSCIDCILYDWKVDEPTVRGGYMYGKKGMTRQHLFDLAESQSSIYFAGEATNTNACCTVQAAMETGIRAANEVSQQMFAS